MKLDTHLRLHAEQARKTVADVRLPPIEQIVKNRGHGRLVAAIAWTAAAATAVVVVVLLVGPAADLTPTTIAPANQNTTTITVPTTTLPSTTLPSEQVPQSDVLVSPGLLAPDPQFDTSSLGIERPLVPVDRDAFVERFVSDDHNLIADEAVLFGLPETSQPVLAVTGVLNNPLQAGYGEPGRCYWVAYKDDGAAGACHWVKTNIEVRPIATGLVGKEWVGWSFLPTEASVAVLTVDGVDLFWQQPLGDIAMFVLSATPDQVVGLRVLDVEGVEIARGDQTRPDEPTESTVDPIVGYGDYSSIAESDIDWSEVIGLLARCANDQGIPVRYDPPDGISFPGMSEDQNRDALMALAQCRAGLNLPKSPGSEWTESYVDWPATFAE